MRDQVRNTFFRWKKATTPLKTPSVFPLVFNDSGLVVFLEEVREKIKGGGF